MIAWLFGVSCPNCDGELPGPAFGVVRMPPAKLVPHEDREGLVCERCAAVIEPSRGRWRFAAEVEFRPLPGVLGLLFGRRAA